MARTEECRRRGRPPDPGRRAERCEEILAAAARVFAERGFAATDVQQVADAAGIGKGTLYRHFRSKRALFLAALDRMLERLAESVDGAAAEASTPLERISLGVRGYLAFFDAHPEVVELLVQERAAFRDREPPLYFRHRAERCAPWRDLVDGLVREGVLRDLPAERVTDVIGHALYGTIFTNHFTGSGKSFEDQARDLVDVVFRGILADGRGPARRRSRRKGARA